MATLGEPSARFRATSRDHLRSADVSVRCIRDRAPQWRCARWMWKLRQTRCRLRRSRKSRDPAVTHRLRRGDASLAFGQLAGTLHTLAEFVARVQRHFVTRIHSNSTQSRCSRKDTTDEQLPRLLSCVDIRTRKPAAAPVDCKKNKGPLSAAPEMRSSSVVIRHDECRRDPGRCDHGRYGHGRCDHAPGDRVLHM
jgi:hypothetical protein